MSINSKDKGARGEREFAELLMEHGFPARRGQQFKGTEESPDVECLSLKDFHFEVKFVEKLNIHSAYLQATEDCGSKTPVVAHRRKRDNWKITLSAEDFLNLLKRVYSVHNSD